MKNTILTGFMLACSTLAAQDTTCVMVTSDETINFDYQTSKIINREKNEGTTAIRVEANEVLCLHLWDEKKRFRDVVIAYDDNTSSHETFNSKDNVLFSAHGYGAMTVRVSKARRKE